MNKKQLKQIIKEQIRSVIEEDNWPNNPYGTPVSFKSDLKIIEDYIDEEVGLDSASVIIRSDNNVIKVNAKVHNASSQQDFTSEWQEMAEESVKLLNNRFKIYSVNSKGFELEKK